MDQPEIPDLFTGGSYVVLEIWDPKHKNKGPKEEKFPLPAFALALAEAHRYRFAKRSGHVPGWCPICIAESDYPTM